MNNKPIIPGPSEGNYNMMELAFHNGEANMKEKVIAKLMEFKTSPGNCCHAVTAEIIKMVERL